MVVLIEAQKGYKKLTIVQGQDGADRQVPIRIRRAKNHPNGPQPTKGQQYLRRLASFFNRTTVSAATAKLSEQCNSLRSKSDQVARIR